MEVGIVMDSSSGSTSSNNSNQSYEAEDDHGTSVKIRVKLFGSNLFEMAIGSDEHKKGDDDFGFEEVTDGKAVVGTVNR